MFVNRYTCIGDKCTLVPTIPFILKLFQNESGTFFETNSNSLILMISLLTDFVKL